MPKATNIKPTKKTKPHVYLLSDVNVSQATSDENAPRQFNGVANSGKPFMHYGEKVIVDLADITFQAKTPALISHDREKRAGFGVCSVENNQLLIKGTLLANDHGNEVAEDADAGFPWQMSAHVIAGQTDVLKEGTATVNGQAVSAPIVILRQCKIPEVSFTPTGIDDQTSAMVLSDTGDQTTLPNQKDNTMTLEEALAEIEKHKAAEAEKDKRIKELEDENAKLKETENKAQLDAQLSQVGFTKSDDGKAWNALSDVTYTMLLSATADNARAMIGDLKLSQGGQNPAPTKPALPSVLLSEQYTAAQTQGVQLSDNPLVANAQARAVQARDCI